MKLRLVNWNVEWATPCSRLTAEILNRIDQHSPDIICLTETHSDLLLSPNPPKGCGMAGQIRDERRGVRAVGC